MKGDIIIVEEYHLRSARLIAAHLAPRIRAAVAPYTISIAGESGSGKSETAQALQEAFSEQDLSAFIFQQDDYFVLPPKSNDKRRRENISWVGTGEVRIGLLDDHLSRAVRGVDRLEKPLVQYTKDRITTETVSLRGYRIFIAEGTYTSLLENIDTRIFIDRNRLDTLASRARRGREPIEPFLERVLEIEHQIIAPHRARADIVIGKLYDVSFVTP